MRVRFQSPIALHLCCECGNSLRFHWPLKMVKKPLVFYGPTDPNGAGAYLTEVARIMKERGQDVSIVGGGVVYVHPVTRERNAFLECEDDGLPTS